MLNYFCIGYEAKIQQRFQKARDNNPSRWSTPTRNWWKYAQLSAKYMFCNNRILTNELKIYADGKRVKLPKKTKSVVINNINSMAQGCFYWGSGKSRKDELQEWTAPGMGDGKLMLMASCGMKNNVKLGMGGHYHRLAQANTITIKLKKGQPISWDGEAWIEEPLTLTFSHKGRVTCPVGPKSPRGLTKVESSPATGGEDSSKETPRPKIVVYENSAGAA